MKVLKSVQQVLTGTGDVVTLQTIANKLGISKERSRQIESSAMKKLRDPKLTQKWKMISDTIQELEDSRYSQPTSRGFF